MGFDERRSDGYYSPEHYQAYNVPFVYYRQFGERHALLTIAPGVYKDQNVNRFRFAGDATVEGVFRVCETWDFKTSICIPLSSGAEASPAAHMNNNLEE